MGKMAAILGTLLTVLALSQVSVFAREIICKEDMVFQTGENKTTTEDFCSGAILPGDSLKIEGKQESSTSWGTESIMQVVSMSVGRYYYYPKDNSSHIEEVPSDSYKGGISNGQLREILNGLEFTTTKVSNSKGQSEEVISGFVNNTGKVIRIAVNGDGPAYNKNTGEIVNLDEKDDKNNLVKGYNFRRKIMYVYIYEPEYDLTYDLDGGSLQGKSNPSQYSVAALEPYSVKIWAPVKEGYHCTWQGGSLSSGSGGMENRDHETGQKYFLNEYWPGYFGLYGTPRQNMEIWFSFEKGYTAVFHGNGGTVNGLDTWISEVDRIEGSVYPYQYTDVNFTPVRAGYQFEGWYLDENFSQKFYGFQDARTYDTTGLDDGTIPFQTSRGDYITDLYAKWSGSEPSQPNPPATETPTTEAPTTEAPTTEAPTTEAPATEAPATEAPATEAPTTEAPATEAPTTEAPATEAPTTEAPATEAPTTEAPQQKPTKKPLPKKNSIHTVKGLIYRVTASTTRKKTVSVVRFTKAMKKKATSVTIPSSVKISGYTYYVTAINDKAFRNNTKLKTVTIGSRVSTIGKQAFSGCRNLRLVTIGSRVTKIGKQAFDGCKNLRQISIKTKVLKKIESYAFRKIKKYAKIYVPKSKYRTYKRYLKASKIRQDIKVIASRK